MFEHSGLKYFGGPSWPSSFQIGLKNIFFVWKYAYGVCMINCLIISNISLYCQWRSSYRVIKKKCLITSQSSLLFLGHLLRGKNNDFVVHLWWKSNILVSGLTALKYKLGEFSVKHFRITIQEIDSESLICICKMCELRSQHKQSQTNT